MPRITLKPLSSLDDISQSPTYAGNYYPTNNYLQVNSSSSTPLAMRDTAIRFPGVIAPAGTTSIPEATLHGWIQSSNNNVACDIYLQASLSPAIFPSAYGAGDLSTRTKTTASVPWVASGIDNYSVFSAPSLTSLFKELMILAGATFTSPGDTVAATPTTLDIQNPVVILKARNTATVDFRMASFESGVDAITAYKIPSLEVLSVGTETPQAPSDRRTHVAILSDSIGWALMPGERVSNVLVSAPWINGIFTQGILSLDDVPGGYVSMYLNGQAYAIDDASGSAGFGSLKQEGRKGYTTYGVLKDTIMEQFNVAESDVVIHPYGLGGTTAIYSGKSTGVWSLASAPGETIKSLSAVNTAGSLTDVTNPLWNYRDESGQTLLQLLRNTTIDRLIVIYIGGGNDFFGWQGTASTAYMPVSRSQSEWDGNKSILSNAYLTIGHFLRDVRQSAGGSDLEYIISGYPNFMTDDPNIPTVKVNVGGPPFAIHRGTSVALSDPDSWYGGQSSGNGYMSPDSGPNPIPWIPFLLSYLGGSGLVTNIPGITIPPGPRPMNKYDLGIFLMLRTSGACSATFDLDSQTDFRAWYGHWAADHYGYQVSSGDSNYDWSTMYSLMSDSSGLSTAGPTAAMNPVNWKIRIPYGGRNINNQTVNAGIQEVVGGAAQAAVNTLTSEGLTCQFVPLWDSLGSAVGSGVTASGGLDKFIDGTHITYIASQEYCRALVQRARVNSPLLQNMTNWALYEKTQFMSFFSADA